MAVENLIQSSLFGREQLVRRSVAAAFLHEDERAIVHYAVVGKEGVRRAETIDKQSPQPTTADLGFRAGRALDRQLRMLVRGVPTEVEIPIQSRTAGFSPEGMPI